MYQCPRCTSNSMMIEKCPNGKIECCECGHVLRPHGSNKQVSFVANKIVSQLSVGVSTESMTKAIEEISGVLEKYSISEADERSIEESLRRAIVIEGVRSKMDFE